MLPVLRIYGLNCECRRVAATRKWTWISRLAPVLPLMSSGRPCMVSGIQKVFPTRLFILTWVILWVITVPLFHTHLPDVTYGPASLQGGLAHTVFSPDLPGEFSCAHDHLAHVSTRVANSPELGFVLSNEDPKSRKMGQPSVLGVLCGLPNKPFLSNLAIELHATHRRLLLYSPPQGPRAPPCAVSL